MAGILFSVGGFTEPCDHNPHLLLDGNMFGGYRGQMVSGVMVISVLLLERFSIQHLNQAHLFFNRTTEIK
jgi:hypothetical protein